MCQDFYNISPTVKLCVHCDVRFVSIIIGLDRIIVTVMGVLNELKAYEKSLGLKDEELKSSLASNKLFSVKRDTVKDN